MTTDDHSLLSDPFGLGGASVISGMRPARRDTRAPAVPSEEAGSIWAPIAGVAWLLALTPGAVIAVKAGFLVATFVCVLQVGIIVVVLMRFAWGKKMHLLVLGIGALFCTLLLAMISFDRSEYRYDVERFDTTVRGAETE